MALRGKFHRMPQSKQVIAYQATPRLGMKGRLGKVLQQAKRGGAQKVGLMLEVEQFQSYEMTRGERRWIRAYPKGGYTIDELKGKLAGGGNLRQILLQEARNATQADHIAGLRQFQLNFIY